MFNWFVEKGLGWIVKGQTCQKEKKVVKRHDQTRFEGTQHLGVKRCCERSKTESYFVITVNYIRNHKI